MAHIKVTVTKEAGRVTFFGEVEGVEQEVLNRHKVCLARTPFAKGSDADGNPACSFALNDLHAHDDHTPPMQSDEAAQDYIDRVRDDIEAAWDEITSEPITYILFEA